MPPKHHSRTIVSAYTSRSLITPIFFNHEPQHHCQIPSAGRFAEASAICTSHQWWHKFELSKMHCIYYLQFHALLVPRPSSWCLAWLCLRLRLGMRSFQATGVVNMAADRHSRWFSLQGEFLTWGFKLPINSIKMFKRRGRGIKVNLFHLQMKCSQFCPGLWFNLKYPFKFM